MGKTILAAGLAWAAVIAAAQSPTYGVGRDPTEEEVRAWDITIGPDGALLPPGEGSAEQGERIYKARCEECHGVEAKGSEQAALVGGQGTLTADKPLKTAVGFWPYATTIFDYIRRAMPFKTPGSLSDSEVYAVTAYLLALDGVIKWEESMNRETLPKVRMPNRGGFIPDPRPDVSPLTNSSEK